MRKIGIVGVGPRGGYSFECLIIELIEQNSLRDIHFSLYEATGDFGNGQIYDVGQNSSNWLNITERILELDERQSIDTKTIKINSFPSYHQWVSKNIKSLSNVEVDSYPPRAQIGKYLSERFQSFINPLLDAKIVRLHKELVKEIKRLKNNKVQLNINDTSFEEFDEILLTIGHQTTELSDQILEWEKFARDKAELELYKSAYPVESYLKSKTLNEKSIIGIRGFGLAMIDVVRAIAEKYGNFKIVDKNTGSYRFQIEEKTEIEIVPFSLDGLPPVPKPLNASIDNIFKPSELTISKFGKQIGDENNQKDAQSTDLLISAFAPIAAEVFENISNNNNTDNISNTEIEKLVFRWLKDQNTEHALFTTLDQAPEESMREFVAMASGNAPISLDFCIGQVWRHCQPTIYSELSYNECSDEVFTEIIKLDESTKRYSYGPPVASINQLLALIKSEILNLDFANNPEIKLTQTGWEIKDSANTITASIMIDSVIDSPKIKAVKSSLVRNLLNDELIQVVHDDLGVVTDDCGYLISKNQEKKIPIALLGRLAKGTVIGVDAILECFGSRPQDWARKAAKNHTDWLNNK